MAFNYINFNSGTPHGQMLRSALESFERGRDRLIDMRDVIIQMRSGDGSQDAHYAEATLRFGFPNDATARAGFEEMASACGKVEGNGSVDNVRAAVDQLFDKMRG